MSIAVKEFVEEFLEPDEHIESPVLLADKVEIMEEGNAIINEEKEPAVQSYKNIYCINTNKRIILASTGIFTTSHTEPFNKTRLASGILEEQRGAKVNSRVSHGFIFHAIKKGEIFNIKFNSGITGRSSFFTAELKPLSGLIKFIAVIGFLLLVIGLAMGFFLVQQPLMITFGIILLIIAIIASLIKVLRFSSPAEIVLENENNLTVVIHNCLEKSKQMTLENGKATEEKTRYVFSDIFLKIDFTEMVTSKQLQDFIHTLTT
jgi:hypothetical protein